MKKIIYIDDEEMMRTLMEKILDSLGYEYLVFENGLNAIKEYIKNGADLIISDVKMPIIDGIDVFYSLKEYDKDCKIVLLSGSILPSEIEALTKKGLVGALMKPFRIKDLKALFDKLL